MQINHSLLYNTLGFKQIQKRFLKMRVNEDKVL